MRIRDETANDAAAIRQVVEGAFGQAAEADLVEALRQSVEAVFSLVAEDDSELVAHILFSKLQAPNQCLALAPISVLPSRQKQGIGIQLVQAGLARAKRDGWQAVFVLGEPVYYERFGFSTAMADKFETPYPKRYFMALELEPGALAERSGAVIYPPAFAAFE